MIDTNDSILMTKQGLLELKKEREELANSKIPQAIDRLAKAREQGDLSENSEYISSKEELDLLNQRLDELGALILRVKIVDGNEAKKGQAGIGSRITLKTKSKVITYEIVGEFESDPKNMKISHKSPLGSLLINKTEGDEFEFKTPNSSQKYKIIKIC